MKFLVNPSKFNKFADYVFIPVLISSIILFSIGLIFAFYLSPDDYQQGSTVRIMYVHVPSAWLALLTYAIMTLYSIAGLAFKIPFGFIINMEENFNSLINILFGILLIVFAINPWASGLCLKLSLENN